jgi:hypothetical protein
MDKIFRSLMVLGLALVAGSGLAASGWDSVAESANAVAGGWAGGNNRYDPRGLPDAMQLL